MKRLLQVIVAAALVLVAGWGAYRYFNGYNLDRAEAKEIAQYRWKIEGLSMDSGFDTGYPTIHVTLARYEKDHWRTGKKLHIPTAHPEYWMYKTLKLDDEVRFKADDNILFPRINDLPGEAAREGIGSQRFLTLTEFPWRTAKAESEREELEKSGPYRHLIDIVNRIKEADAKGDNRDLRYELWNYAITLKQWRGEALVTEPEYLLPAKFWNRSLSYRGNELSLDDGVQRQPTGEVFFRVEQKKGKPRLLAIAVTLE